MKCTEVDRIMCSKDANSDWPLCLDRIIAVTIEPWFETGLIQKDHLGHLMILYIDTPVKPDNRFPISAIVRIPGSDDIVMETYVDVNGKIVDWEMGFDDNGTSSFRTTSDPAYDMNGDPLKKLFIFNNAEINGFEGFIDLDLNFYERKTSIEDTPSGKVIHTGFFQVDSKKQEELTNACKEKYRNAFA